MRFFFVYHVSRHNKALIVWRTSTPEPTSGDGIIWTYLKDATRFIPLFSKPGQFIFELDNLLETGLDGQYASMYQ